MRNELAMSPNEVIRQGSRIKAQIIASGFNAVNDGEKKKEIMTLNGRCFYTRRYGNGCAGQRKQGKGSLSH